MYLATAFNFTLRRCLQLTFCTALALSVSAATYAQNTNRPVSYNPNATPVISVESDTTTLERPAANVASPKPMQVRLTARTENLSGNVNYTWTTTGGRIVGGGATPVWDLTDAQPGVYTATVEAANGLGDLGCKAFSSAAVVVRECAPPVAICPAVRVITPDNIEPGKPLTFVANVGSSGNIAPSFNWTVTGANITSGQGTPAITVDTTGLGGRNVTAAVQLAGYPPNCAAVAEASVPVTAPPVAQRFDEFPSIAFDDDKARLDNLAIELNNQPAARAFVVVYTARNSRRGDQTTRLGGRARDYLVRTRGIDASRITVVGGGVRERNYFELYIVPQGAEPPAIGR